MTTPAGENFARRPAEEGVCFKVRDNDLDKEDSVVSGHRPDMAEECDLWAAAMSNVSRSNGGAVQHESHSQKGRRNSSVPNRCMTPGLNNRLHC